MGRNINHGIPILVHGVLFFVFSEYEFIPTTLPCMIKAHRSRRKFVRLRTKIKVLDENGKEFLAEHNFYLWKAIIARLQEAEDNSKKVVFCEECIEALKVLTAKEVNYA